MCVCVCDVCVCKVCAMCVCGVLGAFTKTRFRRGQPHAQQADVRKNQYLLEVNCKPNGHNRDDQEGHDANARLDRADALGRVQRQQRYSAMARKNILDSIE